MNKPISVGITGGIGSGKTLITKLFSILNVPVYNADTRAKELMNTELVIPIISAFGPESFVEGKLNRGFIAKRVFSNKEQLQKLNGIVHPAVAQDFERWMKEHSSEHYVLKEAALLVEAESYKVLDMLIVVTTPLALRKSRLISRDSFRSEEEIDKIVSNQLPDVDKLNVADFSILNDEKNLLIPQVIEIDKKIRQH